MCALNAERYVSIDIHKQHVVIAAFDEQQNIVLAPEKVANHQFTSWAIKRLKRDDKVAGAPDEGQSHVRFEAAAMEARIQFLRHHPLTLQADRAKHEGSQGEKSKLVRVESSSGSKNTRLLTPSLGCLSRKQWSEKKNSSKFFPFGNPWGLTVNYAKNNKINPSRIQERLDKNQS